jgi:heme-degrading monooxygenase HmoA
MGFYKQNAAIFLDVFEKNKAHIKGFKGCTFLELYQGKDDPTIFFTYSYWESDVLLQEYRQSKEFKGLWRKLKPLFRMRPEAWSLNKMETLK